MRRVCTFSRFCLIAALGSYVSTVSGSNIYETDFSTDPTWTTDQPGNYYWDSTNQWYHATVENNAPGYQPNRYYYKQLSQSANNGFTLSWDIQVIRNDWSSGIEFGLYDSQLKSGAGDPSQAVFGNFGRGDGGRAMGFYVDGSGGRTSSWAPFNNWDIGSWYRCELNYVAASNLVEYTVLDRDTNTQIWNNSLNVPGGMFTNDLLFLGGSRYGMGDNGSYAGVSQYAITEANLDNVRLNVVPVPGAFLLGSLGVGFVGYCRRYRSV